MGTFLYVILDVKSNMITAQYAPILRIKDYVTNILNEARQASPVLLYPKRLKESVRDLYRKSSDEFQLPQWQYIVSRIHQWDDAL